MRRREAGAAVSGPAALRPAEAAFRRDEHARRVDRRRGERLRDQPLVMAGLGVVEAVGVGCVEERDARAQRRVERRERARLVSIRLGREAHAPHADRRAGRGRPHD